MEEKRETRASGRCGPAALRLLAPLLTAACALRPGFFPAGAASGSPGREARASEASAGAAFGSGRSEKIVLSIRGRPLTVEVARSESERGRGLMGRKNLGWNEGMLFVFEREQRLSFWMKNTGIPLSIAFLDREGRVRDIFDMVPYDETSVSSTGPCRYALEANRGFFEECGLAPGDRIDLSALR
jgi:hypothetical protein